MFEGFFYEGHSNSLKMNGLVLSLIFVEIVTGCILCVIHVAETSIKLAGIDGWYR